MQIVHEAGHVLAAWLTRGTVTAVVLHPLAISRTDVSPNPQPLVVVWGGPIIGCALPMFAWWLTSKAGLPSIHLWRFFAAFCLVANGVYIGYGVIEPVGDAHDMLRLGTPPWLLAAFGMVTIPIGFALWNRQGKHFGFGEVAGVVCRGHVFGIVVLLLLVIAFELLWTRLTGFR